MVLCQPLDVVGDALSKPAIHYDRRSPEGSPRMTRTRLRAAILVLALVLTTSPPPALSEETARPAGAPMEPRDAAARARERAAMIAFYNAMGGPDWIQRDFWGSERPVGAWH